MNTPRRTQTRVLKRVGKSSQLADTPPTSPDISRNSFSSQQLSLSSMGSFGSFRDIPDVDPLLRKEKAKQKKEKKKTRKKADKLSQAENDSGNSFSYFGSDSFATSGDMADFGDFGNDNVDDLFPQQALSALENPPSTEIVRRPESTKNTDSEFTAFRELIKKASSPALNKDLLQRYAEDNKHQQRTELVTKGSDDDVVNDLEAAIDELLVASRQKNAH